MAKRALVIKGGTMQGAFAVGALKSIYRMLGPDYFDAIFATSVGVFEQAFFAANQPDIMENTWREYVTGRQLINFWNPFRGRPILDLDYLVNIFQSDKSRLDVEAMRNSHPKLFTFITDYKTKIPKAVDLKSGSVFDIMRATCALPVFYSKKVFIEGIRYVDSWMATHQKFQEVLDDNLKEYDYVLAITVFRNDKRLRGIKNIISPSKMPMRGLFDTNRDRIIATIKQGEEDTEKFIRENNLVTK